MLLVTCILLFLPVLLSGMAVIILQNVKQNLNKIMLSFSGAYLLSISVLHLLPEIYSGGNHYIGVFILAGFVLQLILEFISEGIEHGHFHHHEKGKNAFPLAIITGLCIHTFLEGMPLAANLNTEEFNLANNSLLIGIILHNIPISFVLVTMLLKSGLSKNTAIGYLVLFALTAPLGIVAGKIAGNFFTENIADFYNAMLAIVVGIFLHVSTTILFESTDNHRFNLIKSGAILAGIALALVML